jgi:hypothetical protein
MRQDVPQSGANDPATEHTPYPAAECANCGSNLLGPFCHQCGQAARSPTTSIRCFLRELAADVASLDSKAWRSLTFLLFRPGLLTRDYLAGRRIRHGQPLQLYLVAVAVFFLVHAYRPFVTFDPETRQISSSLNGVAVGLQVGEADIAKLAPGMSAEVFGDRFQATAIGYLPTLLIGAIPLFALFLMLLYRHAGRRYLEHAVFALHWTAFYLLLMIMNRLLPQQQPTEIIIAAAAFIYMVLALRRVYQRPWLGTVTTAAVLLVGFQVILGIWMLSAIAVTFVFL